MAIPSALTKKRAALQQQPQLSVVSPSAAPVPPAPVPPAVGLGDELLASELPGGDASVEELEDALQRQTTQLDSLQVELKEAATPEEISRVRDEIRDLTSKYSSLLGRLRAESLRASTAEARASLASDSMQDMQTQLQAATAERERLLADQRERLQKEQLAGLDEVDDLDESQLDPTDVRAIKALSKKQMVPLLKSLVARISDLETTVTALGSVGRKVDEIGQTQKTFVQTVAKTQETDYFNRELSPAVPDWQQIVQTPQWKAFLEKSDNPASPNVKKGHVLTRFRTARHVPGIVALFREFKDLSGQSGAGLGALATPSRSTADKHPTPPKRLKSTEYVTMQRRYTRTKDLSVADWEAYKKRFQDAQKAGLVDDDAHILNR